MLKRWPSRTIIENTYIFVGVNRIFSKMDGDRSAIGDLLGSTAGINENNIMTYLGLVEQKINELVAMQAFLRSKVGLNS